MADLRELVGSMHRVELLRRIYIRARLTEDDPHRGQGPILEYINDHRGCAQAEVAEALGISPASIACSLRRMEHAGLISRSADEADLRRNAIALTEKGVKAHHTMRALFDGADRLTFAGFDEAELAFLMEAYGRMANNLAGGHSERPLPELMRQLKEMEEH